MGQIPRLPFGRGKSLRGGPIALVPTSSGCFTNFRSNGQSLDEPLKSAPLYKVWSSNESLMKSSKDRVKKTGSGVNKKGLLTSNHLISHDITSCFIPKPISAPCLAFSRLYRTSQNRCPRHLIRPCSTEIMLNHALDPLVVLLAILHSIVPHRGSSWKPFGRKETASKSTRTGSLLSQVISNDRTCPGGLQV